MTWSFPFPISACTGTTSQSQKQQGAARNLFQEISCDGVHNGARQGKKSDSNWTLSTLVFNKLSLVL